ncbi:bifunctional glycosyltransferase family 2/GtrA family protein, partial [Candidatus Parcubacteria bacterium]|nr:bifunctional glycosyltransferase family 2/GtrA family protein [Candidatus Parcubacteria bacterium]
MERTLSIIIPCYNEADTIAEVVAKVRRAPLPSGWRRELIVVNDGSTDHTRKALDAVSGIERVIHREKNGGKGAAVKDGLRAATGDYCLIQDADLELDPSQHQDLLAPVDKKEHEAVFGYRVLAPGHPTAGTILFLGGRAVSLLFNLAFGTRFKDVPCAYKLFPRSAIPALLRQPSDDFVFDAVEMTHVLHKAFSVGQVPLTYEPRSHAQGKKIHVKHGLYSALAIFLIRLGLPHHPLARELPRVTRFIVSGLITVGVNLAFLYVLTEWLHVWYLLSSVVSFTVGIGVGFALHKFWTFKSMELRRMAYQLPLHAGLSFINLFLNTALVYAFVEYFDLWYVGAQFLATGIIAVESFLILSLLP